MKSESSYITFSVVSRMCTHQMTDSIAFLLPKEYNDYGNGWDRIVCHATDLRNSRQDFSVDEVFGHLAGAFADDSFGDHLKSQFFIYWFLFSLIYQLICIVKVIDAVVGSLDQPPIHAVAVTRLVYCGRS